MALHHHSQQTCPDRDSLTYSFVLEALSYDPSTGEFFWKERPTFHFASAAAMQKWNRKHAGKKAGRVSDRGYVLVVLRYCTYRAHRLAWLYMTGEWPQYEIDHRDGNRANNRWSNLRDIPGAGNRQNTKRQANNTSGYTGVVFHKNSGRWHAVIKINRRTISLGYYEKPIHAYEAYLAAKAKYHRFQPRPREVEIRA